jgi:response regulator RpfG family c-di-GMP phosphodiesterase
VTRFQALATLAAGGWLDTIHVYIDALPRNNVQRLAFENATDWERTSPTVNAIAAMLGLSDAQVDDLFIAASQVSA